MRIVLLMMLLVQTAFSQIKTETVEYKSGEDILEGYLAYDETTTDKRPGVIIVHEWWGLNDYIRSRAEQLAKEGYVAFAVDMYGDGKTTTSADEAKKFSSAVASNPGLLRQRIRAGFEQMKNQQNVDRDNLAVIGFCFGGRAAIDLARTGADIKGVAVFHSLLPEGNQGEAKNIKAKILVLHGAEDKFVTQKEIDAFRKELTEAGVTWQMNYYSDAVHAFTNPNAGDDPSTGLAYNERAANMSWKEMHIFFDEIFAEEEK